jgi:hypothetical protein
MAFIFFKKMQKKLFVDKYMSILILVLFKNRVKNGKNLVKSDNNF